ncbi:MAG: dihydrofolate reductase, partial [Bacteroidales bacterium]|nr:dihydrofolate reductase [Candidatus Cryptobacteroides equifaecalis]
GMTERCIIAAIGRKNELGVNGDLPWHIAEDLKYLKRTTLGCPVIMGRTTYESLPFKPLKGRKNIVLSRKELSIEGVCCVKDIEAAFAQVEGEPRCFVMGGASIYAQTMDCVDKLYITHVNAEVPQADVFFPEINDDIWEVESRSGTITDEQSGMDFEFVVYKRK